MSNVCTLSRFGLGQKPSKELPGFWICLQSLHLASYRPSVSNRIHPMFFTSERSRSTRCRRTRGEPIARHSAAPHLRQPFQIKIEMYIYILITKENKNINVNIITIIINVIDIDIKQASISPIALSALANSSPSVRASAGRVRPFTCAPRSRLESRCQHFEPT